MLMVLDDAKEQHGVFERESHDDERCEVL